MLAKRIHSWKKILAQLFLLGLPTLVLAAYVIHMANQYFALLENNWLRQTVAFGAGMALGFAIFARRYRFLTVTALVAGALFFIHQTIASGLVGEFDAFFWSVRFKTYAFFLMLGWVAGYGFSRAAFFSIMWSILMLSAMSIVVANVSAINTQSIVAVFAPVLVYAFYIIYTSELIRKLNEDDPGLMAIMIKRLVGFTVIMLALLLALMQVFKPAFEEVEKEWGGGQQQKEDGSPQNSMTKNDGTGSTTQNNMGLSGFNNKANKDSVLFVAKLDNFFPDNNIPNPLYFTTDYYTKFDTETQTFEIDSLRPYNDLFSPDVSQIPLFYTKSDTSVLRKGMSERNRKVATVEVYKHNLSARLFTAPSTAFYVQPISVPDESKDIYRSAYKAKMLISELNSAYFVYNPAGDAALEGFQEQRFELLRKARGYEAMPKDFISYYTFIPQGNDYDSIRALAQQIVREAGAKTTVDKIIAVRDFFLKKDENGQPTFKYSDNPGIPGMPSANKLTYFLFQNKKGYCAYYAGATLFMLRALGIPSRVSTGFLTVDRSNKNPGWYWFYEDQAHAWVQAYFPEYGWIDFDTTVPDAEQQQSPQPDQTPPMESQTAWLVANGKAISVDTARKMATMQLEQMLYWDQPYDFTKKEQLVMDVSLAKISRDSGLVDLASMKPGETIVAVSYADAFKELPPQEMDSALSLLKRFPNPAPIDEIKIMLTEEEKEARQKEAAQKEPTDWTRVLLNTLLGLALLAIFIMSIPYLVYLWYGARAGMEKDARKNTYWKYMATMYYLNQMGYERGGQTPQSFAQHTVDTTFNTSFAPMVATWQKMKYSPQPLTPFDITRVNNAYPSVIDTVASKLPFKYRFSHFINVNRTIQFFRKPGILS